MGDEVQLRVLASRSLNGETDNCLTVGGVADAHESSLETQSLGNRFVDPPFVAVSRAKTRFIKAPPTLAHSPQCSQSSTSTAATMPSNTTQLAASPRQSALAKWPFHHRKMAKSWHLTPWRATLRQLARLRSTPHLCADVSTAASHCISSTFFVVRPDLNGR